MAVVDQVGQWLYVIGFWIAFSDYEESAWVEGDNEVVHYIVSTVAAIFWPVYLLFYLLMAREAARYHTEEA